MKKRANCHPKLPHHCRGFCKKCYDKLKNANYRKTHSKELKSRGEAYHEENREAILEKNAEYYKKHPELKKKYLAKWRRDNPKSCMISAAKDRAKRQHVPFAITEDDIFIPQFCPILDILLHRGLGKGGPTDNSPTLDKVVPELGYVPDNVVVISWRANRLKSDGTAEEHERIAAWMRDPNVGLEVPK